jgi:hypothetical protein
MRGHARGADVPFGHGFFPLDKIAINRAARSQPWRPDDPGKFPRFTHFYRVGR